jgi:hypothetical protein
MTSKQFDMLLLLATAIRPQLGSRSGNLYLRGDSLVVSLVRMLFFYTKIQERSWQCYCPCKITTLSKGGIAWKACRRQRKLFHLRQFFFPDGIGPINNISKEQNEYLDLLNHKVLQLNVYNLESFIEQNHDIKANGNINFAVIFKFSLMSEKIVRAKQFCQILTLKVYTWPWGMVVFHTRDTPSHPEEYLW